MHQLLPTAGVTGNQIVFPNNLPLSNKGMGAN